MSSGYLGSVACVTDHNSCDGVHEFLELEYVALVSWGEVNCGQSAVLVNGGMQLESVVPALPVFAPCGYAREYAAFCQELGGQFIHHAPSDEDGVDYGTGNIARTVAALKQRNFVVDEALWANTGHDCFSYCSGDSCSGGGGDSGCSH